MSDIWKAYKIENAGATPWGYRRSGEFFIPNYYALGVLTDAFDLAESGLSLRKAADYVTATSGTSLSHQGLKDLFEKKRGSLKEAIRRNMGNREVLKYDSASYYTVAGWIYVITNPAWPEWVKVGMAANVDERANSYQTSSPYRDYEVLFSQRVKNRRKSEQKAHKAVKKVSVQYNGEWFMIDPALAVEAIKKAAL